MGLDTEHLYLLVHSGSRAFGEAILQSFLDKYGTKGYLNYVTKIVESL
jgi:RNA-splicing ligase RtcB